MAEVRCREFKSAGGQIEFTDNCKRRFLIRLQQDKNELVQNRRTQIVRRHDINDVEYQLYLSEIEENLLQNFLREEIENNEIEMTSENVALIENLQEEFRTFLELERSIKAAEEIEIQAATQQTLIYSQEMCPICGGCLIDDKQRILCDTPNCIDLYFLRSFDHKLIISTLGTAFLEHRAENCSSSITVNVNRGTDNDTLLISCSECNFVTFLEL